MKGSKIYELIQNAADLEDKMDRIMRDSDYKADKEYLLVGYDIEKVLKMAYELRRLISESEFKIANEK